MADKRHTGVVVDLVGEVLHRKGRVGFTVASASMAPRLRVGDRAEVEKLEAGGPRVGEIVLFRDPRLGHVLHRVLWRWPFGGKPRAVYTKGDAAPYRDPALGPERLLGRVVRVVRDGREVPRDVQRRWAAWGKSVVGMMLHGVLGRVAGSRRRAARLARATPAASGTEAGRPERGGQVDAPTRRS